MQRHWDSSSLRSEAEQRCNLIHAFIHLDTIPKEWDGAREPITDADTNTRDIRIPTADEIAHILLPWRSLRVRTAAVAIWRQLSGNEAIWVRTHYTGDDSGNTKLLQEWLNDDLSYSPDDGSSWRVLDDPKVFNFGAEWERVLNILPEIASAPQRYSRLVDGPETPDHESEFLAEFRDRLREEVRSAVDKEGQVEVSETGVSLQLVACKRILIVVDEEAFRTGRLLLLFLDAWGNVVRQMRLASEDLADVIVPFGDSRLTEMDWFMEVVYNSEEGAKLGVKYKSNGIRGIQLYQVEDLLR